MKVLTSSTVQALLLTVILSTYAWSLGRDIITLRAWQEQHTQVTRRELILLNDQPSGVDVFGNHLVAGKSNATKTIVFLLRDSSLQSDLNFWNRVNALLGRSHESVEPVGYCDSQQCVDAIRAMAPLPYPVLASGEASSVQAIVKADADGKAILKKIGSQADSKILWRAAGDSPQQAVMEVSR